MLDGPLIRLEPLGVDDVTAEYVSWLNDPETYRYLGTRFGQTSASVRRYVERIQSPDLICKIVRKSDDRHVGNVTLHQFDAVNRRMEIGIIIGDRSARGQGLGRQACSAIAAFGFDHLNLHKITAGTVVENQAMTRVFTSLGFGIEGRLVEHFYSEGRFHDVLRFGVRRSQFRPEGDAR
ncbi:MAG: hypothetical protein AMXMBFR57_16830 [Acidimicrobiia bacterium]